MKMLLVHDLLHGDALTITGQTIAEVLADVPAEPRADQDVIVLGNPCMQGHLAILRGNLATEGAVAKITGLKAQLPVPPVFLNLKPACWQLWHVRFKLGM